ncbi:MAG: cytochrome c oxidase assembly protein [Acidimicrobiaceae bacterium]|nr:cytochrome c oxidase assembly protein [Acidimicrobiaceae bacterium]
MSRLFADGSSPIFHIVRSGQPTLGPYGFFTDIRFHPAPLMILIAATAAYFWAVGRVRSGGRTWPAWRSLCFVAAIVALASATLSGLDSYERSFVVVAVQDGLLAYVAPFFVVLSAPVTLAVTAAGADRGERIRDAFTGGVARVATHPLIAAVVFFASLFLFYFTPLFRLALDHAALWQVVNLALFLCGCLFAWTMAAIDPLPKARGHGKRILWLMLTIPYTTVLGMALESQGRNLAPGVARNGVHTGGGIIWTIGGFLGLFAAVLVLVSWCRLEERSARRRDRALDPEAAAQLAYWKANRRKAAEEAGLLPRTEMDAQAAEALALQGAAPRRALPAGDPRPPGSGGPAEPAE